VKVAGPLGNLSGNLKIVVYLVYELMLRGD